MIKPLVVIPLLALCCVAATNPPVIPKPTQKPIPKQLQNLPKVKPPTAKRIATLKRLTTTGVIKSAAVTPSDSQFISVKTFGSELGSDRTYGISADDAGNVYIAAGCTVDGGSEHPALIKRNAVGPIVTSLVTGNMTGNAYGVAVDDAGNVFLVGTFLGVGSFGGLTLSSPTNYHIFVVKYNATLRAVWAKDFGVSNGVNPAGYTDGAFGVAYSKVDDSIIVTGQYGKDLQFGGSNLPQATQFGQTGQSMFIAKLRGGDGGHVWSHSAVSTSSFSIGNAVAVDGGGNVYVTGSLLGGANSTVDFGGGPKPAYGSPCFLVKYAASGTHISEVTRGISAVGQALTTDATGNVTFAGRFQGVINFGGNNFTSPPSYNPLFAPFGPFVASFSPNLIHRWSASEGTIGYSGAVWRTNGETVIAAPMVLRAFGASGALLWTKSYAGDVSFAGLASGAGQLFAGGTFKGSVAIDTTNIVSAANTYDGFVAEFGTPPTVTVTPTPDMGITSLGPGWVLVMAQQKANNAIHIDVSDNIVPLVWTTIGTWGPIPEDQPIAVGVQTSNGFGTPIPHQFFRAVNIPVSGFAPASAVTLLNTGQSVWFKGKRFNLWQTSSNHFILKP